MKKCTKCGEEKPLEMFHKNKNYKGGHNHRCKDCYRAYCAMNRESIRQTKKAWQEANPEKKQAANRRWYESNAEEARENQRARYHSNPEKYRTERRHRRHTNLDREKIKERAYREKARSKRNAYGRVYRKLNRDKAIVYMHEWHKANSNEQRDYRRKWRRTNPDYARRAYKLHPYKYRAYSQNRRARLAAVGGRGITEEDIQAMIYCQQGLCYYCERDGQKLTLDHVIPIDQNGPHDTDNAVICCGVCNSSKGNRTPEEWTDRWYLR